MGESALYNLGKTLFDIHSMAIFNGLFKQNSF